MNWGKRKENELFTKIRKRKCFVFENLVVKRGLVVKERGGMVVRVIGGMVVRGRGGLVVRVRGTGCEGERRTGCEGERRTGCEGENYNYNIINYYYNPSQLCQ